MEKPVRGQVDQVRYVERSCPSQYNSKQRIHPMLLQSHEQVTQRRRLLLL